MLQRALELPRKPKRSFFLWGPRQVGKTNLLKHAYPNATYIDLLQSESRLRYATAPNLIREDVIAAGKKEDLVIIDEIQHVPDLLNEVHWLIENKKITFALCGSSARKLRTSGVNLLGGRALSFELFGLTSHELQAEFNLPRMLNHGYLPGIYLDDTPQPVLKAYVNDYLTQEIVNEGVVRNLPAFAGFLDASALADTEFVSFSNIASDCGVSAPTVREYYQILVDTLIGRFLHAYQARRKRKIKHAPKFYFADVGIVNRLAKRGEIFAGSELWGKAFENWMFHELSAFLAYRNIELDLSYYRCSRDDEVDFVLGECDFIVECKSSARISNKHLHGLRKLTEIERKVGTRYLVSMDPVKRRSEDGIEIYPAIQFVNELWAGKIVK